MGFAYTQLGIWSLDGDEKNAKLADFSTKILSLTKYSSNPYYWRTDKTKLYPQTNPELSPPYNVGCFYSPIIK